MEMLKNLFKYRKRARDEKGKFVKDDPNTLWNEAYAWNIVQLCKDNWIWILLLIIFLVLVTQMV